MRERRFDKKYRKLHSKPSLTYPGYLLSKSKVNNNVIRRTLRNVSTTFYQFSIEKTKKAKSDPQTWPKNHICQCGNDGEFFLCIPRTLKISLHQKFNCYQKILGSSIFMAEFTGLVL